jgi:uncharacterized integral membrane protein
MIQKAIKFSTAIILVIASVYFAVLNKESVTVHFSHLHSFTSNIGVIVTLAFISGILLAALFGLVFSIKHSLKMKALGNKLKFVQSFIIKFSKARAKLVSGDLNAAKAILVDLQKKDPTFYLAKVELANALHHLGNTQESLKIIDETRAQFPDQLEVLETAAHLYDSAGNKTAALDNLTLLLSQQPNSKAARRAFEIALELGKYEEAENFLKQLDSYGIEVSNEYIHLKYLRLLTQHASSGESLVEETRYFHKKHPSFSPATLFLAGKEAELGAYKAAGQLYAHAAKYSKEIQDWKLAIKAFISAELPDTALTTAKAAKADLPAGRKYLGDLLQIKLYLDLNNLDEARSLIETFEYQHIRRSSDIEIPSGALKEFFVYKCIYQALAGETKNILPDLLRLEGIFSGVDLKKQLPNGIYQNSEDTVSPHLSTP